MDQIAMMNASAGATDEGSIAHPRNFDGRLAATCG
jgi:hypothetical protein